MFIGKTIGELKEYSFYIPAYQRGYRWTETEVIALIEDISEFSSEGDKKYCIQPLIVQKLKDGRYEVVDGQQRLTTIYIFMKIAQQEFRSATKPFELDYETRTKSKEFLDGLSDDNCFDYSNIDFYHISKAYQAINQWLNNQLNRVTAIQKLYTKIIENVFFIWYEIPEIVEPIVIFTKVNLGKIPLTNAELIKALILSKDNFKTTDNNKDDINRQQLEISIAWDKIEQGLQDDSFWFFLNQEKREGTHIDFIFELLAKEYNARYNLSIKETEKYFSFLVFLAMFNEERKNKDKFARKLWNEVEKTYEEFRDWYNDLDNYHIIGFLITTGVSISKIYDLTRAKRKNEARKNLIGEARKYYKRDKIYDYNIKVDKNIIRKLLLLFNIATLVCKSEKQYRFPFDIYKKDKWDIEHIHATADKTADADDTIGNLALLDFKTNRSYKDASFLDKRSFIIKRESNGQCVPVCTKNVFLKVYTENIKNMEKWEEEDKKDYVKSMIKILDKFLEEV